jgi:hypothetical protein
VNGRGGQGELGYPRKLQWDIFFISIEQLQTMLRSSCRQRASQLRGHHSTSFILLILKQIHPKNLTSPFIIYKP